MNRRNRYGRQNPTGAFKYTNTIAALTGGAAALDTWVTASFALGYRVDFTLNGSLQNRKCVAGAANPTDPNGQVVPLDYIGTNSKHWAKIGGF